MTSFLIKSQKGDHQPLLLNFFDLLAHQWVSHAHFNLNLASDGLSAVHEGEAFMEDALRFKGLQLDLNGSNTNITPQKSDLVPYLHLGRVSLEHSLTRFVFDVQWHFDCVIVFGAIRVLDDNSLVFEWGLFRVGKLESGNKSKTRFSCCCCCISPLLFTQHVSKVTDRGITSNKQFFISEILLQTLLCLFPRVKSLLEASAMHTRRFSIQSVHFYQN